MNTGSKVGLGIGIPVAVILLVLVLNIYAISNLQFRGQSVEEFDFVDLSMDAKFQACNPTFFPASFDTMNADMIYKSTTLGTLTVYGDTIAPNAVAIMDGRLKLDGEAMLQLLFGAMGSAFGGSGFDLDPQDVRIVTKLDAPILGFIPFAVTETYTTAEFQNLISGQTQQWSCNSAEPVNVFEDSESIFEQRTDSQESIREPTRTGGPEGAGHLASDHAHASILVRIFGDKFDFSLPAYQVKSAWIHFEGQDGNTIHRHATGVPLGYLFDTIGLQVSSDCFVFQDGREFCSNDDYTLKFYINENLVTNISNYVIQDGDKILISYGSENAFEISRQLDELNSQKIKE